jgi:hypothetical protein
MVEWVEEVSAKNSGRGRKMVVGRGFSTKNQDLFRSADYQLCRQQEQKALIRKQNLK